MHSIQEIGLQEPIDVLEVDGKYYGFSGCHRYEVRRAPVGSWWEGTRQLHGCSTVQARGVGAAGVIRKGMKAARSV